MDFTISSIFLTAGYSSFLVALATTLFCFLFASAVIFRGAKLGPNPNPSESKIQSSGEEMTVRLSGGGGGGMENGGETAVERQTGASMMEQLVPEITTHALSYLDYPSLCRLSMTNSLMRKAANDDNAWKALYHKDFSLEQVNVNPPDGWKAYYAATRAIVNINSEFFGIIRERSLQAMGHFWLNADYVKCVHATGESFSGYNAVMDSWQLVFSWEHVTDFQIRDVSTRVLSNMAWVTMKAYLDIAPGPFNVTNVYEFHNGRWCMVHHHTTALLIHGGDGNPRQG
ncbi:F-box protein skip8 [Phtheirospermum japonicum]|uniref:F-box protein skip8 n=1 Tax=Phtheirospermum japonicum TaxID=374723 RepID=A0A830CIJ0_9LAMI|nr:F-box protein skip8 [Phtheirospermum japonicum]